MRLSRPSSSSLVSMLLLTAPLYSSSSPAHAHMGFVAISKAPCVLLGLEFAKHMADVVDTRQASCNHLQASQLRLSPLGQG